MQIRFCLGGGGFEGEACRYLSGGRLVARSTPSFALLTMAQQMGERLSVGEQLSPGLPARPPTEPR